MNRISDYASEKQPPSCIEAIFYPPALEHYFSAIEDSFFTNVSNEMKQLFDAVKDTDLDKLITAYKQSHNIRSMWGTPYHYLSFMNG